MTPDNGIFAVVAYALTAIVYLGYSAILSAREKTLRAKLEKLDTKPR
jgi:type VI protein secretion system component VasF